MFKKYKHVLFLILNWFILLPVIFAQTGDDYKIISHQSSIKIYPSDFSVTVIDTIKMINKIFAKDGLILKLNPKLEIEYIFHNSKKIKFEQKYENVKIYSLGANAEIIIKYSGDFRYRTEFSYFTENNFALSGQELFIVGTKSYEYFRFAIQTSDNWDIITAGNCVYKKYSNDTLIQVFENHDFIQTLGWICGGKYQKETKDINGISISTYLFPEDSTSAKVLIDQTEKIIEYYQKIFTQYRFKKLDIVEVEDWLAGNAVLAAAFPSVILVKKQAFQTEDAYNSARTILPHEVAHQWLPLSVFVDENDMALLSEGFCEYSSVLYGEWSGDPQARDSLKNHPLKRPLLMRALKGNDLPLRRKADIRSTPTHYLKGAYVHNMLRLIMGDSEFKILLKEFTSQNVLKTVTASDYRKMAENISGKKLEWFFNQWTEQTGIPRLKIYGVKIKKYGIGWQTEGRVRLIGYEKKYTTPVELTVETAAEETNNLYWIGYDDENNYLNEIQFKIETAEKPLRIILDKNENILKYQKLPAKLSDLRDPAEGVMIIGTRGGGKDTISYTKLLKGIQ